MCRWFAYISPEEHCLLSDVLIDPANAISKQCSEHYLPQLLPHGEEKELDDFPDRLLRMRNSLLNMDGFGIAWYTTAASNYLKNIEGPRPALYKSQTPPFNDFNFKSLCGNTETKCVFAHIRATSGSVVSQANSHPFVFGSHIFMHNGVISDFTNIRREMANLISYDSYSNVLGTTDSEHAAGLYMTNLTDGGKKESWDRDYPVEAMCEAVIRTVNQILDLQRRCLGPKAAPNSLNFCTTDGKKMVATRFRNHVTQQPPSLYWSEYAGQRLNTKFASSANVDNTEATKSGEKMGRHTIVSSEPTTYDQDDWHLINKNCALTVDEFGTETEVPIEYDQAFNAVDPDFP